MNFACSFSQIKLLKLSIFWLLCVLHSSTCTHVFTDLGEVRSPAALQTGSVCTSEMADYRLRCPMEYVFVGEEASKVQRHMT